MHNPPPVPGIHHITAYAGDPAQNVAFYTNVLGQRLVKKTVNFDDPGLYHLYYADEVGSPGTVLTFFPIPYAKAGVRGVGETTAVGYHISPDTVAYWQKRLAAEQIPFTTETRFGETVLLLADDSGMPVELVGSTAVPPALPHWSDSPILPEAALRGFHGVTLTVRDATPTVELLTNLYGYQLVGQEGARQRLQASGNVGQFVDVLTRTDLGRGQAGAGTVHHVAFRIPDGVDQRQWQLSLGRAGHQVTEIKDRQYFRSIYFREPNGVLFEMATDAPGFATDETVAELGQRLCLPPWLESQRPAIESHLPPL